VAQQAVNSSRRKAAFPTATELVIFSWPGLETQLRPEHRVEIYTQSLENSTN
jgi:hypothetical protein